MEKQQEWAYTNKCIGRQPVMSVAIFIHFWANDEPFFIHPSWGMHTTLILLNTDPRNYIFATPTLFLQKMNDAHFKPIYLTHNGNV